MQTQSPFPHAETDWLAPENRAQALHTELCLLDWAIQEGVTAHEEAKAAARVAGKPAPASWIRIVLQAQKRRMDLLGLPHKPKAKANTAPAKAPETAAPVAVMPTPEIASVHNNPADTEAEIEAEAKNPESLPVSEFVTHPDAPVSVAPIYLNRAQRRKLARQGKPRRSGRWE